MRPSSRFSAHGMGGLDVLSEDGGLVLCRGGRATTEGGRKGVLIVLPASEQATPAILDRLAHEYSFKEELDSTWAVRPLELVQDRDQTILVLEDPGGELLGGLLGSPMEMGCFLRFAVGIAASLGKAHQHGLIHKDIKPANILVNNASSEVWLTGFGFTSRLPRERQAPEPPETIAGTLAYMAPEQTGRMNRSIDSRSDLYSLGVTFYQMLTGALPFNAQDPLEWVHCHIAKAPVPPCDRQGAIPKPISELVMKLLAKEAGERYQTAAGVEHDLRRCLAEWARGSLADFALGENDVPDRLVIPEKLHGREREVGTLLASFDRMVKSGVPELVLVSGYSGVGKSSVVNELHKVLVPPRGLFAAGKFDQYKRDIPYATVAQAFQTLVRQVLGKSETELHAWRDALREALGANGRLIVDLIPQLELVIGRPPPVAELAPQDAQRRFRAVLRRFMGVFARREHPLALFLDDLQWLDAATLDLIEDLLTQGDLRYLLLIGAYRDNEVDATHPLLRKLDVIRRAGAIVRDIALAPLSDGDLGQLIGDALHCEPDPTRPLIRLVREKTGGNPLFVTQFLHALEDEALLVFDHADRRWAWDLGSIRAKRYSDNVVDLMVGKLGRLPAETSTALSQLACVGSGATFDLLAIVCQATPDDLHASLWEAVYAGLVLRSEDAYAFQHDRIQEAAYSLIPEEERAEAHLRIGRLLEEHTPPDKRGERVFEIVSQFSRSAAVIVSPDERKRVAQLNLMAGERAKNGAAYASALTYFTEGRALLAEDCWTEEYPLAFQLEFQRAECEFLIAELASAEERLSMLANRAANLIDRAAVTCLRVDLYVILVQLDRAIDVGLEYLRQVGFALSPHPTDEEVLPEYDRIWRQLGTRQIEDLIDLPLMDDPERRATIDVLLKLELSALYQDFNLLQLLIAHLVNFSMEHGNSPASCVGYVTLGRILVMKFGDYPAALRFGRLSLALVEKRGLNTFASRVYFNFGTGISSEVQHLRVGLEFIFRSMDEARRNGDLPYIGYCFSNIVGNMISSGEPLSVVDRVAMEGLDFARKTGSRIAAAYILGELRLIRSLRGLPCDFKSFGDMDFDAVEFESSLSAGEHPVTAADLYWSRRVQALAFEGDYASALEAAALPQSLFRSPASNIELAEYRFYVALAQAGSVGAVYSARTDQEIAHLRALKAHHEQLQIWAEQCPENFESRSALVGAELARLEGRELEAERLYTQAVRSAHASGFIHNEALACEMAARFYAGRGIEDIAEMYIVKARDGYRRWGADGVVRRLETSYPRLAAADPRDRAHETAVPDQQLDVAAVVKASQALSGEILLPRLIERLMTIALQSAGADRGLLILPDKIDYRIEAEARDDGDQIVLQYGVAAGPAVPESIIRYVMRTQESIILDDAAKQNLFSEDPYLGLRRQRSILCLPLIRQGTLVGLLYLENALASHVFTPERARLLELLGSQAAISLENARLYGDLREREAKVRRLVDSNIIGICIFDHDRRILEANDAFLGIVGYSRDDVISGHLSFAGLTPPEWTEADERHLAELASTGAWRPSEKDLFRKDGSRVPVLVGGAGFGELQDQGVAFVVDLTERKRAEAELAHANRIATMGQLTASIAHEVNQPIAALLMNAGTAVRWLARQPPDLEKARPLIDRIINDGKRAADIVSRIRDFSKKAPVRKEHLEVNEAILDVMGVTGAAVSEHGASVKVQLSDELQTILGDRVQLQQVILNLIMNAVEAMSEVGEGSRELLISTSKAELDGVLITVADSGSGLPEGDPERIFEAFYTTKTTGLGMGLSICRAIVAAHGGRLWAAPNKPNGTVFYLMLPVAEPLLEHPELSTP